MSALPISHLGIHPGEKSHEYLEHERLIWNNPAWENGTCTVPMAKTHSGTLGLGLSTSAIFSWSLVPQFPFLHPRGCAVLTRLSNYKSAEPEAGSNVFHSVKQNHCRTINNKTRDTLMEIMWSDKSGPVWLQFCSSLDAMPPLFSKALDSMLLGTPL